MASVFVTAITRAEVLYGVELLPDGKRKQSLAQATDRLFDECFRDRILSFDHEAAREFARISAARRARGRPMSQFDAMIAAIAGCHRATLATRNTADFEHCGTRLINPWGADVH